MLTEKIKQLITSRSQIKLPGSKNGKFSTTHLSFILPKPYWLRALWGQKAHPNQLEIAAFIKCLRLISKKIIITDYRYNNSKIDADLSIGFGEGLSRSLNANSRFIYYATGCSYAFQTNAAINELNLISTKIKGASSKFFRFPEKNATSLEISANFLYTIGNNKTASTFDRDTDQIRCLPGIALGFEKPKPQPTNIRRAERKNLVWIGSKGILHKGIHIAAECASKLQYKLVAIGITRSEMDFARSILDSFSIEYELHGFQVVGSSEWHEICERSLFALGCSVSEGMSTALLTGALHGLIPISTDTCGINVGDVISFEPRNSLIERLIERIKKLSTAPDYELIKIRAEIKEKVLLENSPESFEHALQMYLSEDLQ